MLWVTQAARWRPIHAAIAITLMVVGLVHAVRAQTPTNGLIMLIEFEKIDGIRPVEVRTLSITKR